MKRTTHCHECQAWTKHRYVGFYLDVDHTIREEGWRCLRCGLAGRIHCIPLDDTTTWAALPHLTRTLPYHAVGQQRFKGCHEHGIKYKPGSTCSGCDYYEGDYDYGGEYTMYDVYALDDTLGSEEEFNERQAEYERQYKEASYDQA